MNTLPDRHLLTSSAVRSWLGTGKSNLLQSPRVADSLAWASRNWKATPPVLCDVDELWPDRLHALVRVIRADSGATEFQIGTWFHLIEAIDWPTDLFAEKIDLLCQVGYVAWRQAFRFGSASEAWEWEERVSVLAQKLPSVPEFMSLNESKRTDQVRRRFLSDPVVLLAECHRVFDSCNRNPVEALRQAKAAYGFLGGGFEWNWSAAEHCYFRANLALAVSVAEKEVGNYSSSATWLDKAQNLCELAGSFEPAAARIAFVRAALAYQLRNWEAALAAAAELKLRFRSLGSAKYVARCTFVEGVALKELGRGSEALPKLLEVAASTENGVERWFRGWALIPAAEIHARDGRADSANEALSTAWDLIQGTDVVGTIAHFHGVKGEILRDRGCWHASIESYRRSVAAYGAAGMSALEAYIRVLLAEVLIVAGQNRDALREIMEALPVIESLGLLREGVVAIALLRESLTRQEANPEALKMIKSELAKFQKGGHS